MSESSSEQIDLLLDRWEERAEVGQHLTAEELCQHCPELTEVVRHRIRLLAATDWMANGEIDTRADESAANEATTPDHAASTSTPTVEEFVSSLTSNQLMSNDEIAEVNWTADARYGDVQQLADALVQQGTITEYQSAVLLRRSSDPLLVDRYIVLDRIGAGGMGVVFKALHRAMDRIVALKMLPPAVVDSADKIARFRREIKAAARLSHPNVVAVFDASESAGSHFLAMEYVSGCNLAEYVQQHGPMSVPQAVHCVRQAAAGLQHAHDNGVVHRDVKPANLMFAADGVIKVADMGLAALESKPGLDQAESSLTGDLVLGTVSYMSPEQAFDTAQTDARSDIYSLGATLHFLLTGRPPFAESTAVKTLLAHREKLVPRLQDLVADVPQKLDATVQRMLAKDAADRPQSMLECANELAEFTDNTSADLVIAGRTNADGRQAMTAEEATQLWPSFETKPDETSPHQRKWTRPIAIGGLLGFVWLAIAVSSSLPWTAKDDQTPKTAAKTEASGSTSKTSEAGTSADRKPPALAVAPFEDELAKAHQTAWADHLNIPAQKNVELPNGNSISLVLIPPGKFQMGSNPEDIAQFFADARAAVDHGGRLDRIPWETPQHPVELSKAFYMAEFETTQAQWEAVMGSNPSEFKSPNKPVEMVSWNIIQDFLVRLNEHHQSVSGRFALPTEAQWEYACRAGTVTPFAIETPDAIYAESTTGTRVVGQSTPNAWGLHDMHGNVWEWCADRFSEDYYEFSPLVDPAGPIAGEQRIDRGGAWNYSPGHCRSGYRNRSQPHARGNSVGFQLVMCLEKN